MRDERTTVEDVLAGLSSATPDAARAQRVRNRCGQKLSASRNPAGRTRATRPALESAFIGGFCAVYFSLVALIALHSRGVL